MVEYTPIAKTAPVEKFGALSVFEVNVNERDSNMIIEAYTQTGVINETIIIK